MWAGFRSYDPCVFLQDAFLRSQRLHGINFINLTRRWRTIGGAFQFPQQDLTTNSLLILGSVA